MARGRGSYALLFGGLLLVLLGLALVAAAAPADAAGITSVAEQADQGYGAAGVLVLPLLVLSLASLALRVLLRRPGRLGRLALGMSLTFAVLAAAIGAFAVHQDREQDAAAARAAVVLRADVPRTDTR